MAKKMAAKGYLPARLLGKFVEAFAKSELDRSFCEISIGFRRVKIKKEWVCPVVVWAWIKHGEHLIKSFQTSEMRSSGFDKAFHFVECED